MQARIMLLEQSYLCRGIAEYNLEVVFSEGGFFILVSQIWEPIIDIATQHLSTFILASELQEFQG